MYYDPEEDFRQPEPDIDEELKRLKNHKYIAEKEYKQSEKAPADQIKYYHSLLAIEERKSELLDKKYWKEYSRSASLSADVEHLRKNSVYDFSKLIYCFFLLGFLLACAKGGIPSDFIGILYSIILSPIYGLYLFIPMILISDMGGIIGRHPRISALVLYVITSIIIIIAF